MHGDTVLVTGASGFIAGHVIIALLKRGYKVRGTLRNPTRGTEVIRTLRPHAPEADYIQFCRATLEDDGGWRDAVKGCKYVLHVASPIPTVLPRDAEALIRPAREGALRVLRAARAEGVRRVVMTSSVAAVAYSSARRPVSDETDWSDPDDLKDNTAYTRSKTLAERAAWDDVAHHNGPELVTVNPALVLGPVLDKDFSASVEVVRQLLSGEVPASPRVGFGVVDVRDVADLHVRAMEVPAAAGQRFIAATEFLWMAEVAAILREGLPERATRKVPKGELPNLLVRALATVRPILRQIVPELGKRREVSSAKAREQLGWQPRPAREAVLASAQSLIAHKVVRG
jgi:dihydroflavonol-4-reductase